MALGLNFKENNEISKTSKLDISSKPVDFDDPIFCDFQIKWITDQSTIILIEKSRQIGFSWVIAFKAVYDAITNTRDTVISSYNLQASKEVMRECGKWCQIFNFVFRTIVYKEVVNDRSINVFEIKFLNGRVITAISGDAVNFRGKKGNVIIDEAAYRGESLEDILAAAVACIIHGGQIIIGSTHAGIDSEFNEMCEKVRKGVLKYSHHKIDFKTAIKQGLYKRIAKKQNKKYSKQLEKEFIDTIYEMYGIRSSEELDCIPGDFNEEGKVFSDVCRYSVKEFDLWNPWEIVKFRYHDLAASDDKNETAYYSASVRMIFNVSLKVYVIDDYTAEKLAPLEGDAKIIEIAEEDGKDVIQLIEQEPGSSSIKYVEIIKQKLMEKGLYRVDSYAPVLSKMTRALPVANAINFKEVQVLDTVWANDFVKIIRRFCNKKQPLVNDLVDCLSGIFDYAENVYNYLL